MRVGGTLMGSDVELKCEDYHIRSASIGHGRTGTTFRCTISDVTDDIVETLENAARSDGTVRLVFPKEPLVLERIDVRRVEPGCIRIVGRVVEEPAEG
jgi:hypothetical protein